MASAAGARALPAHILELLASFVVWRIFCKLELSIVLEYLVSIKVWLDFNAQLSRAS